jgi:hypothetical protein
MARTKQTARKSTVGQGARRVLATKAARQQSDRSAAKRTKSRHSKALASGFLLTAPDADLTGGGGLFEKGTSNIRDGVCVAQSVYAACTLLDGRLPAANQADYDREVAEVTLELKAIIPTIPATQHLSQGSCFHISVVTKYFTSKGCSFQKLKLQQHEAKALLLEECGKKKNEVYWTVGYVNSNWFPDAVKEEGYNPWHVSTFQPSWEGQLVGTNAGSLKRKKQRGHVFQGRVWCGLFDDSQRPLVFDEALNNANGLGNYMNHLQLYKVTKL